MYIYNFVGPIKCGYIAEKDTFLLYDVVKGGGKVTDNVAVLQGFTKEVVIENESLTLFLLVRPETDLGERFTAWDADNQEFIRVNGWLFSVSG